MEFVEILPIIFYLLGIILICILIVVGIRLLQVLDRMDRLISNLDEKINSLNNIFNVVNRATTGIDLISARVANTFISVLDKIFRRKKRKDDVYE